MQDLERRKQTKELEMLWRGAKSFGKEADVFLGTFPTGAKLMSNHGKGCRIRAGADVVLVPGNYGPPPGFYYEWGNWDPPVQVGSRLWRFQAGQSHRRLSLLSRTGQHLLCGVQPGRARRLLCQGSP